MSGTTDPVTAANTFATTGDVWKPRFRVSLGMDGVHDPKADPSIVMTTALSAQVQKSNWYAADLHRIKLSLFGDPKYGYHFWASADDGGFDSMGVKLEIAFEGALDFTEVFRGFTDKVVIDPIQGIVTITGKNCLGLLADTHYIAFTANPTVGDLITAVFNDANLKPPDTSAVQDIMALPTGREFLKDQSIGSVSDKSLLNPLDLLQSLCQVYGMTMSEAQGVVKFDKEINGNNDPAFLIQVPVPDYGEQPGVTVLSPSNVVTMTLEHNLNLSQWNWVHLAVNSPETGKPYTDRYPPNIDPTAPLSKVYPLHSVNRSPEDNPKYAQSMFEEFMMHEAGVTAQVGGPQLMGLKLSDKIAVNGTGTKLYDGWYAIDSIEHNISFKKGYTGTVKGRFGRFPNSGES